MFSIGLVLGNPLFPALGLLGGLWVPQGCPWVSWRDSAWREKGELWGRSGVLLWGALGADPVLGAGGVSPQSLSEWRMQNIARDSENSSEEEFFDAHGMIALRLSKDQAPAWGRQDAPGRVLSGWGCRRRGAPPHPWSSLCHRRGLV